MLKKTITFEDFDGNTVSEDFYFHLSKAELMELEMSAQGGFGEYLTRIVKTRDGGKIIAEFKKLILMAYGVKSDDGKRFIKSPELNTEFQQTDAFSTLFMELATDAGKAGEFINGIVPVGLAEDLKRMEEVNPDQTALDISMIEPEDTRPAWIIEDRDPTDQELRQMSKAELADVYRKRMGKH